MFCLPQTVHLTLLHTSSNVSRCTNIKENDGSPSKGTVFWNLAILPAEVGGVSAVATGATGGSGLESVCTPTSAVCTVSDSRNARLALPALDLLEGRFFDVLEGRDPWAYRRCPIVQAN